MKKITLFILALSLSFAGFSQDGDSDYKWLVGAQATGAMYASSDAADAGTIMVDALYGVTDDLMVGATIGLNFGDIDGENIHIGARYYFGDIFAAASYDLGDSDTGVSVGLGYGWDVADNVEFAPQLGYNPDMEIMTLGIGFAIRF